MLQICAFSNFSSFLFERLHFTLNWRADLKHHWKKMVSRNEYCIWPRTASACTRVMSYSEFFDSCPATTTRAGGSSASQWNTSRSSRSGQLFLEHHAALHYEGDLLHHRNVVQGITLDRDDVGVL